MVKLRRASGSLNEEICRMPVMPRTNRAAERLSEMVCYFAR